MFQCLHYQSSIVRSVAWHSVLRDPQAPYRSQLGGGADISAHARKYMHEKLTKFPNFTRYLPEKYSFFFEIWGRYPSPTPRLLCV